MELERYTVSKLPGWRPRWRLETPLIFRHQGFAIIIPSGFTFHKWGIPTRADIFFDFLRRSRMMPMEEVIEHFYKVRRMEGRGLWHEPWLGYLKHLFSPRGPLKLTQ